MIHAKSLLVVVVVVATAQNALAQHAFKMLVLGDSYAWQPELLKEEKSFMLVRQHIAEALHGFRPLAPPRVFARSGAVIGEQNYERKFLEADAAAPWPGDVPDAFWDDPHPRGDKNYAAPSMWRQLARAKDSTRRGFVDPRDVDLVIVSGGGNDVAITNIIAPRAGLNHHQELRQWVRTLCGERMKRFLPAVADAFPNAKIVVTGYPQVISHRTNSIELAKYLGALGIGAVGLSGGLPACRRPLH